MSSPYSLYDFNILSDFMNPKPPPKELDVPPVIVSVEANPDLLLRARKAAKKGKKIKLVEYPVTFNRFSGVIYKGDTFRMRFNKDEYDFDIPDVYKSYLIGAVRAVVLYLQDNVHDILPMSRRIITMTLVLKPVESE